MASLEERVAAVETQADRHSLAVEMLRGDISNVRLGLADLRLEVRTEIATVRGQMATRVELAELRSDMNRRFELVDAKLDRLLFWLTGVTLSGFFAVISALIATAYK